MSRYKITSIKEILRINYNRNKVFAGRKTPNRSDLIRPFLMTNGLKGWNIGLNSYLLDLVDGEVVDYSIECLEDLAEAIEMECKNAKK